jgi:hypothetical protein
MSFIVSAVRVGTSGSPVRIKEWTKKRIFVKIGTINMPLEALPVSQISISSSQYYLRSVCVDVCGGAGTSAM